jgi:hypothetical protein
LVNTFKIDFEDVSYYDNIIWKNGKISGPLIASATYPSNVTPSTIFYRISGSGSEYYFQDTPDKFRHLRNTYSFFEKIYNQTKKQYEYIEIDKIEIDYEGKNDRDNYTKPSGEFKYFWGDKFYSERELEKERINKEERQKKIDNYNNISNLHAYIGVYEVSIYTFQGIKLNTVNKGKFYITEEGITLISDLIIDDNTLRGSHIKDSFYTPSKEGQFYCKVSKGLWDEFTCSINLESKSGAITTSLGKEYRTTTFSIIKKLD